MQKIKNLVLSGVVLLVYSWNALAESPAVPAGAEAPAGGPAQAQAPGMMGMLFPFILMFAVVYFLMIRPQQKKMKEHQKMLTELQQGDEVLTASGILGKVSQLTDKVVTVEIAKNVEVKMLKNQVSQVVKGNLQEINVQQ